MKDRLGIAVFSAACLCAAVACGGRSAAYPDAVAPDSGGGGGTTGGGTGGASGPAGTCEHLAACDCVAAADRCAPVATPCWCSTCSPAVQCLCGGGTYHGCQAKTCPAAGCGIGGFRTRGTDGCITCDAAPDCATALGRVQLNCSGPDVASLTGICSDAARAPCIAACLAKLGACSEVTCAFCQTCDCATAPTTFTNCVVACRGA